MNAASDLLVERLREALRLVIDPELGYNIVDLGLVYDIEADAEGKAHIKMTTTTRGCPATEYLQQGALDAASAVTGVKSANVVLVYQPPWTPEMMTSEAQRYLGIAAGGGW